MSKKNSGFTLVEILLSILILSIVVTGTTAAFSYAIKVNKDNRLAMTATNLANESIEYIRSLEFNQVGTKMVYGGSTIYGDPKGEILQTTTKTVDGIVYIVNTIINWEQQGGWDVGDTDWDYKSVKVIVVPKEKEGNPYYTKVIETYVTRNFSQPALTGANIQLRLTRGWNTTLGTEVPVPNVKILLETGPSAPRQVLTTSGGVARFIDLDPGAYKVHIDPSTIGMMLLPTQAADWNPNATDGTTQTGQFKVEYPCRIQITLKDLDGNPITLSTGITGQLKLNTPFSTVINKPITSVDIDAQGRLTSNFIPDLWPVGEGYAGVYTISDVQIPECQYLGSYETVGGSETSWSGTFDAPNTTKNITCYIGTIPETPSDIFTSWVDATSCIITDSTPYTAMDDADENMSNGSFSTTDLNETIYMNPDTAASFNGVSIFFENKGTETDPGLVIGNRSNLTLRTGMVVFRGEVNILNNSNSSYVGKIVLSTTYDDGNQAECIDGSLIDGGTPGVSYGKLYLAEPMMLGTTTIVEPGGYYFPNGLALPDNVSDLIKITKDNYISN